MTRKVFYKDKDFSLELEEINQQVFVHVGFYNFSKKILRKLLLEWQQVLMRLYYLGYEEVFTYTKDPRIVNIVGGSVEIGQDNPDLVNLGMRMYKWDLTR